MTKIAMVVLDTLRKDAFDEHFEWLPGTRFENAYSTSNWTVPVHASLFTGTYATEVGSYAKSIRLGWNGMVLPERLAEAGFTTRAFSCNPNISPQFDFDRGFSYFDGSWRLVSHREDIFNWYRSIAEMDHTGPVAYLRALTQCARADVNMLESIRYGANLKLQSLDRFGRTRDDGVQKALSTVRKMSFSDDEFLFVNLMEAHAPYTPPPDYRTVDLVDVGQGQLEDMIKERSLPAERLRQAYDDSVRYLSEMYQELFAELASSFDYIITLSDHGELFGEHGSWQHDYGVYPELVHVPLSIWCGEEETTVREDLVSLLDVHATVLDACNLEITGRGISLFADTPRKECIAEYHGISHQEKLDRLRKNGIDKETIKQYDAAVYGIARDEGYYGYEALDEYFEQGETSMADPRAHLHNLVDDFNIHGSEDEIDLDSAVTSQLSDLGYI